MARSSPILTAFNAGELSPQLRGRVDLEKYAMGCEILENFACRVHGGAQRRPGLYYTGEVKDSAKSVRLIPFEHSSSQAYILEFGNQYIRVFRNQGQVLLSGAPYEIASPYLEADLWGLKYAQHADLMYLVHPNYAPRKLTRTGHTSWTLAEVQFTDGPYLSQNETDTTLTPSGTTGDITLTASASLFEAGHVGAYFAILHGTTWGYCKITYVTDATHANATVKKTFGGTAATKDWCEGAWSIKCGFPCCVTLFEQRSIFAGTKEEPQTIWASAVGDYEDFTPGTNADDPYVYTISSDRVNAIRWLGILGNVIIGTIGGEARLGRQDQADPITPTNAKITFQSWFGSADIQAEQVGSALLFIERAGHPDNLGERLREFSYKLEIDGYAGVDLTILAEHVTAGGIVQMAMQNYPYRILWCVRNDGQLLGMTYDRDQDVVGWHRHITDGYVESVAVIPGAYQDEVWCVVRRMVGGASKRFVERMEDFDWGTDDRYSFFVDCALTYDGDEAIITGATQANPVVITTVEAHGYSNGDVILLTDVEGMTELNWRQATVANASTTAFECSGLDGRGFAAYTGGGLCKKMAITVTGMNHLIGETVSILADGAVHPDAVVAAGGSIVLERYAAVIHAGLPFSSTLKTMGLEGGAVEGTAQGKMKRIHSASIRFHKTLGAKAGPDADNLDTIIFRMAGDLYGHPPALFTGDKELLFPGEYDTDASVMILQDQPLPMTVLSIMPRFKTEDR